MEVAVGRGLVLWTKNSLHLLLLPSQPLSYVIVWALLLRRCASALCCPRPNRERGGGGGRDPTCEPHPREHAGVPEPAHTVPLPRGAACRGRNAPLPQRSSSFL